MNTHRYIARYCIEAKTPLGVGAGTSGLENERLIAEDANGLPYIPGTGITGVLRHELEKTDIHRDSIKKVFGFQEKEDGRGSSLSVSPACLLHFNGEEVVEGIIAQSTARELKKIFQLLPERDHVRISDKGVAVKHGKFAEKLVFAGTRFVFEIEFTGIAVEEDQDNDAEIFEAILGCIESEDFRLGAGTRNGFGAFEIIWRKTRTYDLREFPQLEAYLQKTSSLNAPFEGAEESTKLSISNENWLAYELILTPEKYFLFGSGDLEYSEIDKSWLDNFSKKERKILWINGKGQLSYELFPLIPATSVKGALAHRTAYFYNQLTNTTIESTLSQPADIDIFFDLEKALEEFDLGIRVEDMNYPSESEDWHKWKEIVSDWSIDDSSLWEKFCEQIEVSQDEKISTTEAVGEANEAVRYLFGYAKQELDDREIKGEAIKQEENKENMITGGKGKVIISDIYLQPQKTSEKVLTHVAIDRFTGGAKQGALFDEKVIHHKEDLVIKILVEADALDDVNICHAFKLAIEDLCNGTLPLGGNIAKGHGTFTGSYKSIID